jgi:acyl carrier protein
VENSAERRKAIEEFLREAVGSRGAFESILSGRSRIVSDEVIDSLKLLELIGLIEAELGHELPEDDLISSNFDSIEAILNLFG